LFLIPTTLKCTEGSGMLRHWLSG